MGRPILLVAGDLKQECLAVFTEAGVPVFESLQDALPAILDERFQQNDGVLFMRSERRPEGCEFQDLILILPVDESIPLEDFEKEVLARRCIGLTHSDPDEIGRWIKMFQGCLPSVPD